LGAFRFLYLYLNEIPTMKISLTLFILAFSSFFCCAQSPVQVVFFNRANALVKTRDSAYYIRTVYEMDKATSLYDFKEMYFNGKPRRVGKTYSLGNPTFEGVCTLYFLTGEKAEELNYVHGKLTGDIYQYFRNGLLNKHLQVRERPANIGYTYFAPYLVLTVNDSLGKPEVVDGNGHYVDNYFFPQTDVTCEGYLKNGLREGQWKGVKKNKGEPISFTEVYKNGNFISGVSVDLNNKSYSYTNGEQEIIPKYKFGEQAFNNFLTSNIVYPKNARKKNITGRVYVIFTVEKDGTLDNIKAAKSGNPDPELVAEAIRVMQKSPNWEPGRFFGQAVAFDYTVPINFKLGNTR